MNYDELFHRMDFNVYEEFPWKHGSPFKHALNPLDLWEKFDLHRRKFSGVSALLQHRGICIEYKRTAPDVTGEFMHEEGDRGKVVVYVAQRLNDRVIASFGQMRWNRLKFRVIQAAIHETIHRMQFLNRNMQTDEYQYPHAEKSGDAEYLSYRSETQAWAHCAYMEYMLYRIENPMPMKRFIQNLREMQPDWKLMRNMSEGMFMYMMNFSDDDPSFQKFLHELRRWNWRYNRIRAKARTPDDAGLKAE